MSHLREYRIYKGMKGRCFNPALKEYPNYGGRGIRICDRWLSSTGFLNFIVDLGLCPDPAMSLDRIDVNGNYEPGNCRWASSKEQHRNRRKFKAITSYTDVEIIQEYEARFGPYEYGLSQC